MTPTEIETQIAQLQQDQQNLAVGYQQYYEQVRLRLVTMLHDVGIFDAFSQLELEREERRAAAQSIADECGAKIHALTQLLDSAGPASQETSAAEAAEPVATDIDVA